MAMPADIASAPATLASGVFAMLLTGVSDPLVVAWIARTRAAAAIPTAGAAPRAATRTGGPATRACAAAISTGGPAAHARAAAGTDTTAARSAVYGGTAATDAGYRAAISGARAAGAPARLSACCVARPRTLAS
jgi:hypothetical protein